MDKSELKQYEFIINNKIKFKNGISLIDNAPKAGLENTVQVCEIKDIYAICSSDFPVPLGKVTVVDSHILTNDFGVCWNIRNSGIDVKNIKGFIIDFAFIPTRSIPMINFSLGVDDGGDGLVYADYNMSLTRPQDREIFYGLFCSETVHMILFDGVEDVKVLDFSIILDQDAKNKYLDEVEACYASIKDYEFSGSEEDWQLAIHEIAKTFNAGGFPVSDNAKLLYEKRMAYAPAPSVTFLEKWPRVKA